MAQALGHSIAINAGNAATAWLNAFLATGSDEERPTLYRTICVEFFEHGVQFVATSGHLLLRAWCPKDEEPQPITEEMPELSVVVMDSDKFALAFIKATLSAAGGEDMHEQELSLSIEESDGDDEPALGSALGPNRLTLRAFGQELHCRLYEAPYPNWRALDLGIDKAERVDAMKIATRLFGIVGKLKGIIGIDCEFIAADKAVLLHGTGTVEVRGLLMPMRRDEEAAQKKEVKAPAPELDDES